MSIYNRSYMRPEASSYSSSPWALKAILITLVAVFFLQNVFRHWFGVSWMEHAFALNWDTLSSGYLHTLLTYGLLHSTELGIPWHLLLNALMLYLFGREIEFRLGTQKFIEAFGFSVLVGGIAWILVRVTGNPQAILVGASAGVFGIITLFCMFRWYDELSLLFIPGRFLGKHLFYFFLGMQAFFFLFTEMPRMTQSSVAYSAHLGGILGGFIYYRQLMAKESLFSRITALFSQKTEAKPPKWEKKVAAVKARGAGRYKVNLSPGSDKGSLRKEVDRILDKINDEGFGALTQEEKQVLDKAKDLLK